MVSLYFIDYAGESSVKADLSLNSNLCLLLIL